MAIVYVTMVLLGWIVSLLRVKREKYALVNQKVTVVLKKILFCILFEISNLYLVSPLHIESCHTTHGAKKLKVLLKTYCSFSMAHSFKQAAMVLPTIQWLQLESLQVQFYKAKLPFSERFIPT